MVKLIIAALLVATIVWFVGKGIDVCQADNMRIVTGMVR